MIDTMAIVSAIGLRCRQFIARIYVVVAPPTRFLRNSIERGKPFLEFVGLMLLGATVAIGILAFDYYKKANRATCRGQLYSTEQLISTRELEDLDLRKFFCELPDGTPPERYLEEYLSVLKLRPENLPQPTAEGFYQYLWETTDWNGPHKDEMRKIYLHAETYLYHLHNAHDYMTDHVIEQQEWDTWKGLLADVGTNPFFVAAVYAGHESKYMSQKFACEVRNALIADPNDREYVSKFYPALASDELEWIKSLPDY